MHPPTFSDLPVWRAIKTAGLAVGIGMVLVFGRPAVQAADAAQPILSTLEQMHTHVLTNGRAIASFRVQGVVCAVSGTNGMLVLQDHSSAVLLELPALQRSLKPGDNIMLAGTNSTLTRSDFGIQIGTAPVVDADGRHPVVRKSGEVYLNAGLTPLRVEWLNAAGPAELHIEYEGPGIARTKVPASMLFHSAKDKPEAAEPVFKPGLEFTAYAGSNWQALPDFRKATGTGQGITSDFDISRRPRPDQSALVFIGYLKISTAGLYTFHVATDDGCRLFAGDASAHCQLSLIADAPREVTVRNLAVSLSEDGNQQRSQLEGKVNWMRTQPGLVELEIGLGQRPVTAVILNWDGFAVTNLMGATVRATGIFQRTWMANDPWPARLVVPGAELLQILNRSDSRDQKGTLTSVGQIRALSVEQTRQRVPVQIRGVITMANYFSCVLQDASGGIYLPYNRSDWANQPRPGELWEFHGVTDAGEFSPVVIPSSGRCFGNAALPRGVRPTWSEFQDGSLDAVQVEIEAAVVEVSETEMTLLTRDGIVTLLEDPRRPFARGPDGTPKSLLGSVVRLRGVYTWTGGLVTPRMFRLGNVTVSIVEPPSTNWFLAQVTPIRDLLQFRLLRGL